jgi:hypothetical protein
LQAATGPKPERGADAADQSSFQEHLKQQSATLHAEHAQQRELRAPPGDG